MNDETKKIIAGAVLLVALTWWLATDPHSPMKPEPPKPDRPVLKFLVKAVRVAARVGLAAMWFMEPAPQPQQSAANDLKLDHQGADGYPTLRHEVW